MGVVGKRLFLVATLLVAVTTACNPSNDGGGASPGRPTFPPGGTGAPGTPPPADGSGPGAGRQPLVWYVLGDSYSAGVGGTPGGEQQCENRSPPEAFGSLAAGYFEAYGSWSLKRYRFRACGGATIDVPDPSKYPPGSVIPPALRNNVLRSQVGDVHDADIVTLTAGGNDAGFADFGSRCFVPFTDEQKQQLQTDWEKKDYLHLYEVLKQYHFQPCPSWDGDDADLPGIAGPPGHKWETFRNELVQLYKAVVGSDSQHAPNLYVLTYPIPFAKPGALDISKWTYAALAVKAATGDVGAVRDLGERGLCQLAAVKAPDYRDRVGRANALAERMDEEVSSAVTQANDDLRSAFPDPKIHLVDWRSPFGAPEVQVTVDGDGTTHRVPWNEAGICSPQTSMVHSLTIESFQDTAHPTTEGYDVAVKALLAEVGRDYPYDAAQARAKRLEAFDHTVDPDPTSGP